MFRLSRIARVIFAALFVAVVVAVSAAAQSEKSTGAVSPTPETEKAEREKKLAVATDAAKQLLLVMDADHKGQLDVKELTQSRVRMRPYVGK